MGEGSKHDKCQRRNHNNRNNQTRDKRENVRNDDKRWIVS